MEREEKQERQERQEKQEKQEKQEEEEKGVEEKELSFHLPQKKKSYHRRCNTRLSKEHRRMERTCRSDRLWSILLKQWLNNVPNSFEAHRRS